MTLHDDFYTLTHWEATADAAEARIRLNDAHPIYQGHFPGQPITPGVIILAIARELLEKATGKKLYLKGLPNVKYSATLVPSDRDITVSLTKIRPTGEGCWAGSASFSDETAAYARFSFECQEIRP